MPPNSASRPARGYPAPMPMTDATDRSAMTDGAWSASRWSLATPIISAVNPRPTPWAARPASSHPNESGSTVSTLPPATTASVPMIVARRRGPAPRRPSSGMATAPDSSVMVSVHWALASDTRNVVATLVIKGAPRLPMAATTSAMKMREGTSRRACSCRCERGEVAVNGSSRP